MSGPGALAGLLLGVGALLALGWWRDRRPLPLADRIGPFVGVPTDVTDGRGAGWRPSGIMRRIGAARPTEPIDADRVRTVRWSALGVCVGLAVSPALGQGVAAPILVLLAAAGGSGGWWLARVMDGARTRRRQRVMLGQLPMLADLVSLAVSAGASPFAALESAADALPGPLAEEVQRAGLASRSGVRPDAALAAMVDRVGLPEVRRFVDALLLATELGTPIGAVARTQALEIRGAARRRWTEEAARRDVGMLVPIVFLVLPSVVLVALFPGLQSLRLVVP